MAWEDLLKYADKVLDYTLFTLNNNNVTVSSLIVFIIFMMIFTIAGRLLKNTLYKRALRKFDIEQGMRYTLARLSQYLVIILGILFSFQFLGINLSSLAVIFGLLSVGIGFGLQNLTSNFISGLIVLFERPISVGDRVMVNEIEGDVTEINIRSTTIRTLNNVSIIVPNSEFVSKDVVNYSHGDSTYRLDIPVGVSYGSDLDKVQKALFEVAKENDEVLPTPEPDVHLKAFGDSAWDMELRVWIPQVNRYPKVRNEINCAIVRKFRDYDIEIPFPQRDLHVRSPLPLPHSVGNREDAEDTEGD